MSDPYAPQYDPRHLGEPATPIPLGTGEYDYRQGYGYPSPPGHAAPRRKKRRIFLWIFLAVQALFLIWLIAGIASAAHGIPAYCHQGTHSQFIGVKGCTSASQAGAALGAAAIIVFWMVVDVILGIGYGVYKLATRGR